MLNNDLLHTLYQAFLINPQISIDTRTLKAGDVFFALSGPNFNGNQYAAQALELGASLVVVDEEAVIPSGDERYLFVPNSLEALQQLGNHHRLQSDAKVLAITGSNGKTTTKELIASVLTTKYKIIYTQGNLNNHIGVPLTLLTIKPDTEIAVVEMGANHVGEIGALCEIAMPDCGLITNIGKAHLEGFGSVEGIKKGKGEMYDYLKLTNGRIFLNTDERFLEDMAEGCQKISRYSQDNCFGNDTEVAFNSTADSLDMAFEWNSKRSIYQLQMYGIYNTPNILAALNIGFHFGIDPKRAAEELTLYIPQNKRSQKMTTKRNTLYLDSYNANPTSMRHAILSFAEMNSESKMAILGDMFELGEERLELHQEIADLACQNVEEVWLVGSIFLEVNQPQALKFKSVEEVIAHLENDHRINQKSILLKGSRGMALERLVNAL